MWEIYERGIAVLDIILENRHKRIRPSQKIASPDFSWAKPGDTGRQCKVALEDLRIDHSYQRAEVSEQNTLHIAVHFNWIAFGSIVAMERSNGHLYVVDGQQRMLAAKRRGDIKMVPAIVFRSDGRDHEARAFIALNCRRSAVAAVAKFRASVNAKLSPEKDIADWMHTIGLSVGSDGGDANVIQWPHKLLETWRGDENACKDAIIIQQKIGGGIDQMTGHIHRGLWWLLHNNIDPEPFVDKLIKLGGIAQCMKSIRTVEIATGRKLSDRSAGVGLLRLINFRNRTKIEAPE